MTLAPANLTTVAGFWTKQGGVNLGIVGDTRHVAAGTSYHLGSDHLKPGAYSAIKPRDVAGLSIYASAFDMGKLGGTYTKLRIFSGWLVDQCRHNAPDTRDIREVIWSPDGATVLRWDRERGVASEPRDGEADSSHLTHTHVSWYRDSRGRSQVGPWQRYFAQASRPHVYISRGAVVRVYAWGGTVPGGNMHCIASWRDEPWTYPHGALYLCEPLVKDRPTCDGKSKADTVHVLEGPHRGDHIRIGRDVNYHPPK